MQNDFISGPLGSPEAQAIVPKVCEKIATWDGDVVYTMDSHFPDYPTTLEGKHIPINHCMCMSDGWQLDPRIEAVRNPKSRVFEKLTFGSRGLCTFMQTADYESAEIVGLCTDVCVISNALALRMFCLDLPISVDASCCAGTSAENHKAALTIMKACCIDIVGEGWSS